MIEVWRDKGYEAMEDQRELDILALETILALAMTFCSLVNHQTSSGVPMKANTKPPAKIVIAPRK